MATDLTVKIGGDASGLKAVFGEVNAAASRFSKGLGAIGKATGGLLPVAGLASVGLAAGKYIGSLNEIADSSERFGISTDAFQQLSMAAKLGDVEVESMARAMQKLTLNTIDAAGGSKEAIKKFDQWGVSVSKLTSMNAEDKFGAVAEAILKQESASARLAMAYDLMGKSAKDILPGLSRLAEARKMDLIPADTIAAVDKLDDSLKKIGMWTGAKIGKGLELLIDMGTGDLFTDPLKKRSKAEAEAQGKARDKANAEMAKAMEAKAVEDKKLAIQTKVDKEIRGAGEKGRDELAVQNLLLEGKEKEAFILEKMLPTRRQIEEAGGLVSAKDSAALEDTYGKLYDVQKGNRQKGIKEDVAYDALRKIGGGIIGGGVNLGGYDNGQFSRMNNTLSQIKSGIDNLIGKKNAVVVA